jgi:hypothetical protein
MALLADGRLAVGCSLDVQLWDVAQQRCSGAMQCDGIVAALAVLEGGRLAVGAGIGCIEVWRTGSGALEATLRTIGERIR